MSEAGVAASKAAEAPLSFSDEKMAILQGAFYLASGLWPIVSLRSFEKVTGPKTDDWLVKTVGLLIAVSGAVFLRSGLRAGLRRGVPEEIAQLARAQALALGSISLFYAGRGCISKIYLLDAAVELGIVGAWMISNKTQAERNARALRLVR